MQKFILSLLCLLILIQATGCGTLLYPERKGQSGGRMDGKVVLMDGLLCLLFIIPGVVAFVVDMDSGCIYLPGGYGEVPQDIRVAQTAQQLQMQFVDGMNQNIGEKLPITLENGSYKIEQVEKFKELANFSSKVHIYYDENILETVEIQDGHFVR